MGFAGASGTGKTALARHVAERYGLEVNPVGSRSVAMAMGYANPYDVDAVGRRVEFQDRLLFEKAVWEAGHADFVTDRTTLDNLAYAALHQAGDIGDAALDRAIDAAGRYTHVFFCPIAEFQKLAGDPVRRSSRAYHEVFEALLSGLLLRHAGRLWRVRGETLAARATFVDLVLTAGPLRPPRDY